jgi:hypothetical protein
VTEFTETIRDLGPCNWQESTRDDFEAGITSAAVSVEEEVKVNE